MEDVLKLVSTLLELSLVVVLVDLLLGMMPHHVLVRIKTYVRLIMQYM